MSNVDTFFIKVVALDGIYKFVVLSFLFEIIKMLKKNNIKFHHRINRVQALIVLKKSYLSYMVSNGDIFYMKVIALDGIYKFIVFGFCI